MAAAEHVPLLASFDSTGKWSKGDDGDGNGGDESKRQKVGNLEGGSVAERARLALIWLPMDAARPERSAAAWCTPGRRCCPVSTESTGRLFKVKLCIIYVQSDSNLIIMVCPMLTCRFNGLVAWPNMIFNTSFLWDFLVPTYLSTNSY